MANISTLLASILSARYGRDMRQHLHDAIKAVNDDTEDALGSSLAFNTSTRKLSLKAKNNTPLSEVVIPGGGSGGGSVDSVNGIFPDENGDVTVGLGDVDAVELSEPTSGQVLKFDGTNWVNANESGGGGTSDYTDLTNKPQVNGVTLSGNKTSADLGIFAPTITSPTSGQVIKYDGSNWVNGSVSGGSGGSNRNLLDNPWFTVNQKGFTSGSISDSEITNIDRWKTTKASTSSGTVAYNSTTKILTLTDLTSSSGGQLFIGQTLDWFDVEEIRGVPFTISLLMGDALYSQTVTFPTNSGGGSSKTVDIENGQIRFALHDEIKSNVHYFKMQLRFQKSVSATKTYPIQAIKVELGTQSTLALDVAPDYSTELLKCQRFYVPLKGYFSGIQLTNATLPIQLSVPMRTTPTISVGGDVIGMVGGTATQGTIQSASVVGLYGSQAVVSLSMIDAYNSALTFDSKTVFNAGLTSGYLSAEL